MPHSDTDCTESKMWKRLPVDLEGGRDADVELVEGRRARVVHRSTRDRALQPVTWAFLNAGAQRRGDYTTHPHTHPQGGVGIVLTLDTCVCIIYGGILPGFFGRAAVTWRFRHGDGRPQGPKMARDERPVQYDVPVIIGRHLNCRGAFFVLCIPPIIEREQWACILW